MTWFSDQLAAGLGLVREAAGESIVYATPDGSVTISNATPLRGNERDQSGERRILEFDELDWGIAAADIVINGNRVEPAQGHTITRALGGQSLKYAAMSSQGEKPWVWSDPGSQTQYRIHTKLIGKS